jgi:hypothetical protein
MKGVEDVEHVSGTSIKVRAFQRCDNEKPALRQLGLPIAYTFSLLNI